MSDSKTFDEFLAWIKEQAARDPDYLLSPHDCREFLVINLRELVPYICEVLFEDPSVKNYFAVRYGSKAHPEFDFEVCFRRMDGQYPGPNPTIETEQALRIAELEAQLKVATNAPL